MMNGQRFLRGVIVTLVIVVISKCVPAVMAETIELSFTSLPSAQGWSYGDFAKSQPETAVMQLADGELRYDTTYTGGTPGYTRGPLAWDTDAFIVEFTMKVSNMVPSNGHAPFSAAVGVGNDYYRIAVGITPTNVGVSVDGTTTAGYRASGLDNQAFHNYMLQGTFGVDWTLFRDNVSILTGGWAQPYLLPGYPNGIWFGDGTIGSNAAVSISALSLRTVPEPSTIALLGIGAIGVFGYGWGGGERKNKGGRTKVIAAKSGEF